MQGPSYVAMTLRSDVRPRTLLLYPASPTLIPYKFFHLDFWLISLFLLFSIHVDLGGMD